MGLVQAPPLVHEINRLGEALMVLASILVFWAYGGFSLTTKNKRQQRRTMAFTLTAVAAFLLLLFVDSLAGSYDPALAANLRKAGEGIGWIFQMGMGYTFYLPFALYMVGLLAWSYTVVKLYMMGRYEGIGIGLMFLAGYALTGLLHAWSSIRWWLAVSKCRLAQSQNANAASLLEFDVFKAARGRSHGVSSVHLHRLGERKPEVL